jgi:hypothetical protein
MMFTIRPFEANDIEYQTVVVVENATWPEFPGTVEEWKHQDETRDPKYLFRRFVVEVEGEIMQDVPSPDPHTKSSLKVFEKRVFESPGFLPKAQLVALDGGRWIGMSGLWQSQRGAGLILPHQPRPIQSLT